MIVQLTSISSRGLHIQDEMDLASLLQRLRSGENPDMIGFSAPPKVDLTLTERNGGYALTGTVSGSYEQQCSRCGDPKPLPLSLDVSVHLKQREEGGNRDVTGVFDDDVGMFHFTEDKVDLGPIVEELILLSISPYWSPPTKEDGTCCLCGIRDHSFCDDEHPREEAKISFGELLRKAGVNKKG